MFLYLFVFSRGIELHNMVVPWVAHLGTKLKMIEYGMDNIWAKFGALVRVSEPNLCPQTTPPKSEILREGVRVFLNT